MRVALVDQEDRGQEDDRMSELKGKHDDLNSGVLSLLTDAGLVCNRRYDACRVDAKSPNARSETERG